MKTHPNETIILQHGVPYYIGTYCIDIADNIQLRVEGLEFTPESDEWCIYDSINLDFKYNGKFNHTVKIDTTEEENEWVFDTLAAYVNYEGQHQFYSEDKIKVA